ncbi:hypothetical protein GQ44DRAFT_621165, partial [Phaeosphaeriaceae sp. PMI808]
EDNDPSHGTKTRDNVVENIVVLLYLAQSPNLNPIEGLWLILKYSKRYLKQILQEAWAKISMDKIRDRIVQMLDRCQELCENGGEKVRSEKW